MSPSSANDLLKTLAEIGYLEFDERSKHYYIGARAAMFGHWAAGVIPSVGKLEGFARELCQRTRECVILSTYCRGAMLLALRAAYPDGVEAVLDLVNGRDAIRRGAQILKAGGDLVSTLYTAEQWFAKRKITAHILRRTRIPFHHRKG